MIELRSPLSERNHAGLNTDRLQLRSIELVRASRKLLKVDVR